MFGMTASRWSTNKVQALLDRFIEIARPLNAKLDGLLEPYKETMKIRIKVK